MKPPDAGTDSPNPARTPRLSPVLIHLLKGVLYRDQQPRIWEDLMELEAKVADYFRQIGLDLVLDDPEGFAYLKQGGLEGDSEMPRLIQRRPLGYALSLLCVLLRKKLVESDAGGAGTRVVLEHGQIVEMMRLFLPQRSDEALLEDKIGTQINRAVEMDLLKPLKSGATGARAYEVRPIIKALVDGDWLASLEHKLKEYQEHGDSAA